MIQARTSELDLSSLQQDGYRLASPFSPDVSAANALFASKPRKDSYCKTALVNWIKTHQPCVFARHAALMDALTVAVVTPDDLSSGRAFFSETLQTIRRDWLRRAYLGRSFGLVLILTADELIRAAPDRALMNLATAFVSIFAQQSVRCDQVVLQPMFLRHETDASLVYRWETPINLFAVQGDQRWWHHRRIPGGLALSINSVGHMMKATAIDSGLGACEINKRGLNWALRTIQNASFGPHGATSVRLAVRDSDHARDKRNGNLTPRLDGFRNDVFLARYDTDIAVPRVFFDSQNSAAECPSFREIALTSEFSRPVSTFGPDDWSDRSNREAGAATVIPLVSMREYID
jgi:hypothetical protein